MVSGPSGTRHNEPVDIGCVPRYDSLDSDRHVHLSHWKEKE